MLEWALALVIIAMFYLGLLPDGETVRVWFTPDKIVALVVNCVFGVVCLFLGILIHELGHALAGAAAGIEILKVQIGMGRELFTVRPFGTKIVFHSSLAGGMTYPGKVPNTHLRTRYFILTAGGMAAQVVVVGAGILAMDSAWSNRLESFGLYLPHVFTWVNLFMAGFSLFPFISLAMGTPYPSDGRQLLRIPFLDDVDLEDYMAAAYLNSGVELLWKGDYSGADKVFRDGLAAFPRSRMLMNNLSSSLISQGRCEEARKTLGSVLDGDLPALTGAFMNLNMAAAWIYDGSAEGIEKAVEHSEKAYVVLARLHGAAVIRGAALMEVGRVEEAMVILKKEVNSKKPLDKLKNKTTGHIYLAYGYHMNGEEEKGGELVEKVESSREPLSPYDRALLERIKKRTKNFW